MNTTNQDLLDLAQALQWLSPPPEINPLIVEDDIDPDSLDEEQAPIAAMYYISNRIPGFRRQCLNALHRTPDQAHRTLERFIKNWHIDTLGFSIGGSAETLNGIQLPPEGFNLHDGETTEEQKRVLHFLLNWTPRARNSSPPVTPQQLDLIDPAEAAEPAWSTVSLCAITQPDMNDVPHTARAPYTYSHNFAQWWDDEEPEDENEKEERDEDEEEPYPYLEDEYNFRWNVNPAAVQQNPGDSLEALMEQFKQVAHLLYESTRLPTTPDHWRPIGAAIGWLFNATDNPVADLTWQEVEDSSLHYWLNRDWSDCNEAKELYAETQALIAQAKSGITQIANSLFIQHHLPTLILHARNLVNAWGDYAIEHIDKLRWPADADQHPRPAAPDPDLL